MNENTLFGAPMHINSTVRSIWSAELRHSWHALTGHNPADLDADLAKMRPWFGAGVSARRLKDDVWRLPTATDEAQEMPRQLLLIVDGCALITPEGRIYLDLLDRMTMWATDEIDRDQRVTALQTAWGLRTSWERQWIDKQFGGRLSAPPLAAALFLLINGSIGEKHALTLPSSEARDRDLGAVVLPLLASFSRRIDGRERDWDEGLRGHWAVSQVTRFLGRYVARTAKPDGTAALFVKSGAEERLTRELTERLADHAGAADIELAVGQFLNDYRAVRRKLAAIGEMHEDPTRTNRVVRQLTQPRLDT